VAGGILEQLRGAEGGMDQKTIAAYDRAAKNFSDEWRDQPPPQDMYDLFLSLLGPGRTVDIGCGSGRDAAWLTQQGHQVLGVDASVQMIAEAKRRFPETEFLVGVLPQLEVLGLELFDNVVCETVIMHLPIESMGPAVRRLLSLIRPAGVLYLSWRVSAESSRDTHGRLYQAFDDQIIMLELVQCESLYDAKLISESSGREVRRIAVRKKFI